MTIRKALDTKRSEREGTVTALVLCKHELFYLPSTANAPGDSVYPVTPEQAAREAEWFKVPLEHA